MNFNIIILCIKHLSKKILGIKLIVSHQIVTASGMIYTEVFPKKYRIIWSFFPPNLLAHALTLLTTASEQGSHRISWSKRAECLPDNDGCVLTIVCSLFEAQKLLILTIFDFLALT